MLRRHSSSKRDQVKFTSKLKVKISELKLAMDKAVEEKDLLKTNDAKQSTQKLEKQIKGIVADTSYISRSQSLLDVSGVETPVETAPKVTPKATPENSTPGSTKATPCMFKKCTPGQLAKEEEMKKIAEKGAELKPSDENRNYQGKAEKEKEEVEKEMEEETLKKTNNSQIVSGRYG